MTNLQLKEMVDCPYCGKQYEYQFRVLLEYPEYVNAVEEILNFGHLDSKCPACGKVHFFDHEMIFRDTEKKYQITYIPIDRDDLYDSFVSSKGNPKWTIRIVRDYQEMVEKTLIYSLGLDDRIIEFIKLKIRLDNKQFYHCPMYFVGDKDCYIIIIDEGEERTQFEFDKTDYDAYVKNYQNEKFFNRTNDFIVNQEYAERMIFKVNNQKPLPLKIMHPVEHHLVVCIPELDKIILVRHNEEEEHGTKVLVKKHKTYEGIVFASVTLGQNECKGVNPYILVKTIYKKDVISDRLNDYYFPKMFCDVRPMYRDEFITKEAYEALEVGKYLFKPSQVVFFDEPSKNTKNCRFVMLAYDFDDGVMLNKGNAFLFKGSHFKITDKYEKDGIYYVILLNVEKTIVLKSSLDELDITKKMLDNYNEQMRKVVDIMNGDNELSFNDLNEKQSLILKYKHNSVIDYLKNGLPNIHWFSNVEVEE